MTISGILQVLVDFWGGGGGQEAIKITACTWGESKLMSVLVRLESALSSHNPITQPKEHLYLKDELKQKRIEQKQKPNKGYTKNGNRKSLRINH